MQEAIKIYTDGAARGNPGRAGWAAVILFSQNYGGQRRVHEIGGHVEHATNNIMELTAPIEAMKYLIKKIVRQDLTTTRSAVEIFSDSKYVILGITAWIYNWQKNNWRNTAKKSVMNRELWEELFELTQGWKPRWNYVKGHNGDKYNDRADDIATSFADNEPVELKK